MPSLRFPRTTVTFLLWFVWTSNKSAHASIGCPCVQDLVTFKFDLQLGCPSGTIVNPTDFQKTSCIVNDNNNARVKKVVIHDHQVSAISPISTTTLPVLFRSSTSNNGVEEEDPSMTTAEDVGAYYYFQYHRSAASPSVLFMDLFTSSNTLSASVDLYFATSNRNCIVSSSPIFWPSDNIYFLTVMSVQETSDPMCHFPHEEQEVAFIESSE